MPSVPPPTPHNCIFLLTTADVLSENLVQYHSGQTLSYDLSMSQIQSCWLRRALAQLTILLSRALFSSGKICYKAAQRQTLSADKIPMPLSINECTEELHYGVGLQLQDSVHDWDSRMKATPPDYPIGHPMLSVGEMRRSGEDEEWLHDDGPLSHRV